MDTAILLALPPNTATPLPGFGTLHSYLPQNYFPTYTYTPSVTPTFITATQITNTQTATMTLAPLENTTAADTSTPEIVALETQPSKSSNWRDLFIPFCGLSLILLGLLLFWFASKRNKQPKYRSYP